MSNSLQNVCNHLQNLQYYKTSYKFRIKIDFHIDFVDEQGLVVRGRGLLPTRGRRVIVSVVSVDS